jgi:hypothetical protein
MILAFALVILLLMSLMGVIVLANARTELNITGNTRVGREAFNSADTCARIATLLTLVLLNPRTDDINDVFQPVPATSPAFPIEVDMQPRFNLDDLMAEATNYKYADRYLEAGVGAPLGGTKEPHIIFRMNGREIARAVVNLETYNLIPEGMGIGTGDPNDSASGPKLQVGVVVSVSGKTHQSIAATGADDPSSVVTIMYRNYIN